MKTLLFRVPIMILFLGALFFQAWSLVDAEEMTCPGHIAVNSSSNSGAVAHIMRAAALLCGRAHRLAWTVFRSGTTSCSSR